MFKSGKILLKKEHHNSKVLICLGILIIRGMLQKEISKLRNLKRIPSTCFTLMRSEY